MNQLKQFIDSLKTTSNAPLIEAAMAGYNSLFEGYADVVTQPSIDGNAFSRAQRFAASVNPAMNLLARSQSQLGSLYSEDEDAWLDKYHTSEVSRFSPTEPIEFEPTGDVHEDSLGLTARELANYTQKSVHVQQSNTKKTRKKVSLDLSGI